MRYLPRSSLLPMRMGFLWHVISTSSYLFTAALSLVKMDTLPSSAVLSTRISDVGDYLNVSASAALLESCRNGSVATYLPLQAPPLATPNSLSDTRNIGRPNCFLSFSLRLCPSAPELYVNIVVYSCLWYMAIVGMFLKCTCIPSPVMLLVQ